MKNDPLTLQPALIGVLVPSSLSDKNLEQFINTVARRLYFGKEVGNVIGVDSNGKVFALNTLKQSLVIDPGQVPVNNSTPVAPPVVGSIDTSNPKTPASNLVSRDNSVLFLGAAATTFLLVLVFIFFVRRSRKTGNRG